MEIAEMKPAQCKECGRSYKIKPEMLGKKIKCQCGAVVRIPDETGAVPRGSADANDIEAVQKLQKAYEAIRAELSKVIVGQSDVIEELLISIFAKGHCLLEGVPGLAKTLLISSLAKTLSLSFHRIQFTPDLMPADITGTEILQDDPATGKRAFQFLKGPLFANIVLADEINRTPPKTQAALLEAMQEKRVSIGGKEYKLEPPFFVLATQNPLEQEGTYPLPEAQLDRFIFKIYVNYPSLEEEIDIMKSVTSVVEPEQKSILGREDILELQHTVRKIPVADHIFHYVAALVRATRPSDPTAPQFIKDWVSFGAGPRASLNLILAGKARAALRGRFHVSVEDVRAVAMPVMRHRLGTNFAAQSEGITSNEVVKKLLDAIPADEKLYDAKK
jgi:MoxR-like ATPase